MKRRYLAMTAFAAAFLALQGPGEPRVAAGLGRLPLQFIPNEGQVAGPAAFYVQGRDKTIHFAADGLTFVLGGRSGPAAGRWVVKLDFVDADPNAAPVSLETSGAVVSYFRGKSEDWRAGLRASSSIVYRGLWPGIDLVYGGTVDRMKYEFVVHPGADPSRIQLAYRGASSVTLTEEGRLAVATPAGSFEDDVPAAWQELEGGRRDVPMAYVLRGPGEGGTDPGARRYGFRVGEYDRRLPLVLDPAIVVYCGFIGGSGQDRGAGIAVDAAGNAYVVGDTLSSPDFPVAVGPDLTLNSEGLPDAFIAKVKADGTGLVYCGFIGGGGTDEGSAVAVDASGNAYVTGRTSSADFPVTAGSSLTYKGDNDAFVAKVSADGTALVYSGLVGGQTDDAGFGIAVGGSENAYVAGEWAGNTFVGKINTAGTALAYIFHLGGGIFSSGRAIALDASENAYITGMTSGGLPVKVGPDLTWNDGWHDAFVAKVDPTGTDLVYCGYIGGEDDDVGYGIAVDGAGCAYVTGHTSSDENSFPVKVGPDLTWNGGSADAFVAKVNAAGSGLAYCGYIGGAPGDSTYGGDSGRGIAVDGSGNAYIAGQTESAEGSFPVVGGPDLTFNGYDDAFAAKVNAAGTALIYCGYIGGAGGDSGSDIALDASGNVYLVGETNSSEASFPVTVGPDLTVANDYGDAFVAKISSDDVPGPVLTAVAPTDGATGGPAFTLTVTGSGFADGAVVMWDGDDRPTAFIDAQELWAEVGAADLAVGKVVSVTVRGPDGGISNAAEFTVNNPAPALTSLAPVGELHLNSAPALTLTGSNFVSNSVVRWGGSDRPTTFVSGTALTAALSFDDMRTAGRFPLTVYNPPPGGGTSGAVDFSVVTYGLAAWPDAVTVTAGEVATYTVRVSPLYGSVDTAVSLSCTGQPTNCSVTFMPNSVTPGANPATTTLTISTRARTPTAGAGVSSAAPPIPPAAALSIFLAVLVLWLRLERASPAKLSRRRLAAVALVGLVVWIAGCSAGGGDRPPNTGTLPGTYRLTIHGKAGNLDIKVEEIYLVVQPNPVR